MNISEPYAVNGVLRNGPGLHQLLSSIVEDTDRNDPEFQLPDLTIEERDKILQVLERDAKLHSSYKQQVSRLKSELSWLRRKSAIKVGQEDLSTRVCGRCQTELGLLLNRGAVCSSCRQRVCKDCRKYGNYGKDWVCIVCSKQIEIQLATGEWLNEFIRRPSRRKDKNFVSPSEGVRKTLVRRSWSISSPSVPSHEVKGEEIIQRRVPPVKPPRKSLTGDENEPPPWHDGTPNKPPRRFSMSSFDAPSRRPSRGHSAPSSRGKSPEYRSSKDSFYRSQIPHNIPKYYFFGNDKPLKTEPERPSTLPRRPLQRPLSVNAIDHDVTRFYSIPRNKNTRERSPSGSRGHSVPAPFVSSGPVTSTPIGSSYKNHFHSLPRGISISQDDIKVSQRRNFEPLKNLGRANSSGEFWSSSARGSAALMKLRDDEGGGANTLKRNSDFKTGHSCLPFDSGVSEISQDTSDEGGRSPRRPNPSRPILPRSNTSITSGFASIGRPTKNSESYVRRTQSFQARSLTRPLEDDLLYQPRKVSGSKVAKFVQQLEKGIHQTMSNMHPRKTSDSFKETSSLYSQDSNPSRDDGRHSDLSGSDVALENHKILPEGEDYRLVFISSDSSKESELNSSIDSDNSVHVANYSPVKTDWKSRRNRPWLELSSSSNSTPVIKRENSIEQKKHHVDVAVNTEVDYISDDSIEAVENNLSNLNNSTLYRDDIGSEKVGVPSTAIKNTLITSLGSLNSKDIKMMLEQTEVVQAEAQALQKALMGAFDAEIKPSNHWEKRPEGVSKDNHVIPCHEPRRSLSEKYFAANGTPALQSDYVNFQCDQRDENNLYENVAPTTKSICIQTDLGPPSWEDDYETGDYSDVSCDDSVSQKNLQNSFDDHYVSNKNVVKIRGHPECTKGKDPPLYLPSSPPLPQYPQSPVHLHSDSSSVSLSSECESVRGVFDVIRGHSGVILKPKCAVNDRVNLFKSDSKIVSHKNDCSNIIKSDAKEFSEANVYGDVPKNNFLSLTGGGGNQFQSSEFRVTKMNVAQTETKCSSESLSDINASEQVIPGVKIEDEGTEINKEVLEKDKTSAESSGTSDGDDTDDDIHVSRSYNVSHANDSESNLNSGGSEVDGEETNNSSKTDYKIPQNDEEIATSQPLNPINSESENVMGPNNVLPAGQLMSNTVEKTELPECDQAIEDDAIVCPNDSNQTNDQDMKFQRSDSRSDCENVENKSETESTLGLDADTDSIKEDSHQLNNKQIIPEVAEETSGSSSDREVENKCETITEETLTNSLATSSEDVRIVSSTEEHQNKIDKEETDKEIIDITIEDLDSKNNCSLSDDSISDINNIDKNLNNDLQNSLSSLNDQSDNKIIEDKLDSNVVHADDSQSCISETDTLLASNLSSSNEISHSDNKLNLVETPCDPIIKESTNSDDCDIILETKNEDMKAPEFSTNCIESPSLCSTIQDSECAECKITGSTQVERCSGSCTHKAVTLENVNEEHECSLNSIKNVTNVDQNSQELILDQVKEDENSVSNEGVDEKCVLKENSYSSESGHSSGGESEADLKEEVKNIVKIDVIETNDSSNSEKIVSTSVTDTTISSVCKSAPGLSKVRKNKRSSSSEGLSSSSDIDRSDGDASDSADTVIDNKVSPSRILKKKKIIEEFTRDSDGPSSADSVLHGGDSESQCSDASEEGNLVTIVAVGEESMPKHSSQGKIYISSDSTDSDVQIKPTCIVVSGSGSNEEEDSKKKGDVTILEVTSDHRKDHVMSVRVTSPESSRNASPTRKSNVSELQSMILTHRERQQHIRHPPVDGTETSSLTNYFTVTLGTESPLTPRRINKTPEVRRRKVPDKGDTESPSSTPTLAVTPTPTLTPSPSHTPSPTDHSEGDILAYEEHHKTGIAKDPFVGENQFEERDEYYEDYCENEQYGEDLNEDAEGTFDSIEDAESIEESNYSETSSEEGYEREEELRGYCKRGYDFTLHTIIEESCEESDYEKRVHEEESLKRDQSELEKYFYFGLGNGPSEVKKYANEESEYSDTFSETSSSVFSEGMESLDGQYDNDIDPAELASNRLEKYFSGFMGFERQPSIRSVGEESEIHTDESGSVGSDSEGSPSPEQPRKKLFKSSKSRGVRSARSHGYSSDKGESAVSDGSMHSIEVDEEKNLVSSEAEASTESEEIAFDKGDGQFDTIKRRKKKKLAEMDKKSDSEKLEAKFTDNKSEEFAKKSERIGELDSASKKYSFDEPKSPKEKYASLEGDLAGRKYQSRDSGFIGSSDDLLKDKPDESKELDINNKQSSESGADDCETKKNTDHPVEKTLSKLKHENDANNKSENEERSSNEGKVSRSSTGSSADLPPYSQSKGSHNLSRKDSFNNWSSDEETNIMMNKMRLFFKNMFSNGSNKEVPKAERVKAPQLVMFEARLTNLMRSVPGINDEQVKEIVEYLSSEETWSDSYDSSDYTSSDLEGAYARLDQADPELKSELQEQISASCQQIIKKFDQSREPSDNDSAHSLFGCPTGSECSESSSVVSKDAAFVYQKLLSSFSHMKSDSDRGSVGSGSQSTSPPLLMKVIHHIGDRIVALMHEVSAGSDIGDDIDSLNGGNPMTSSPRQKLFLPKKYDSADSSIDKSSLASGSFDSEDSPTDTEQSPESETGTPKVLRTKKLPIINERSSAEDFTSFEGQKSNTLGECSRPHYTKSSQSSQSRSRWHGLSVDAEKFDGRDHHVGLPKMSKSGRRTDPRKAKSHMSLEKIQYDDMKTTGERSESLGDLLDRVRSSSEFSSSYEQLDSDSTLRASDSLDRQIGSSSSNVRLNASSRGSLTTSSRGSLATSSRGSLQGSSGAEEDEERKSKKFSVFRYARRSSVPDATKDNTSPEMRSTTLPRSTPAHILTTGTLPRSQTSQGPSPSASSYSSPSDKPSSGYHSTGPRSARYHPPGYRPPPAGLPPKRTYSTPTLRKERLWPVTDESGACLDEISVSSSAITSGGPSRTPRRGLASNGSSRTASPLGGSLGRTSGSESVGGSLASFETSIEEAKRRDSTDGTRSPLMALGPKSRSESLASVYSTGAEGRFGSVPIQGEALVALQYNYKEGQLECHILQCRDLAPFDSKRNRSDPYMKAYLLPDKSKSGKRKTKVKRHSLNPVFEEVFKFCTTLNELESRTLWLSVWHSDMFGRNVFLGEILIPLSDALFEDSSPKWYTLTDRNEPLEDLSYGAVLIIALKFLPPDVSHSGSRRSKKSRGTLQVRVKEALGLTTRSQSLPDPICKGVLMPEKGKISKHKTNVIRKTVNPRWNHSMTFDDVTLQELTERSLELSIWDHDRFGSSEFLGGCRLNLGKGHHNNKMVQWLDASGLEQKLWEQMLERPNLWVESSILLRPNIERPIYSSAFTD